MRYRYQWLIKHWLGATVGGLALAMVGHWLAELTFGMFEYWREHGLQFNSGDLVWVSAFVLAIFVSAYFIHNYAGNRLSVEKVPAARHAAMILFLSQSVGGKDLADETGNDTEACVRFQAEFPVLVETFAGCLRQGESPHDAGRVFGRENWCMPFVAIAYHADARGEGKALDVVAAIGSADTGANGRNGSWRQAAFFQEMVVLLFERWGTPQKRPRIEFRFGTGVDFFDPVELSQKVKECDEWLHKEGFGDAVVDVTGGTKECSIAGAASALEPGRKFQYVSTGDRIVRQYDLTYQKVETAAHGGH